MKNYWELCDINSSIEERNKLNIGDIFANKAKCLKCGEIIRSKHRHDYVTCKCGNLSVDGGSWYARRVFEKDNSYEDMITYYKHNERR